MLEKRESIPSSYLPHSHSFHFIYFWEKVGNSQDRTELWLKSYTDSYRKKKLFVKNEDKEKVYLSISFSSHFSFQVCLGSPGSILEWKRRDADAASYEVLNKTLKGIRNTPKLKTLLLKELGERLFGFCPWSVKNLKWKVIPIPTFKSGF